jgi:transcriptional regulator with XRE-family HTH domain
MGTHQRAIDLAREDERRMAERVRSEVRDTRIALGMSQADVGRAAGMSHAAVSRFESGIVKQLRLGEICRLCRAVGLQLHISSSPTGVRVRDAASLRILGRFEALLAPPLRLPREVLLPAAGELRAWDAAVVAGPSARAERAFVEVVSRFGDAQATARYLAVKLRDDGRSTTLILVIGRTRANRAVLAEYREALRQQFPLDGSAIARALRTARLPPASGIIVL